MDSNYSGPPPQDDDGAAQPKPPEQPEPVAPANASGADGQPNRFDIPAAKFPAPPAGQINSQYQPPLQGGPVGSQDQFGMQAGYPPPPSYQPGGAAPWGQAYMVPGAIVREGIFYVPAGFMPRFFAFLLDLIVLSLLSNLLILLAQIPVTDPTDMLDALRSAMAALFSGGASLQAALDHLDNAMAGARILAWLEYGLCAAYFTIAHGMFGTSPGKMVYGLRVLRRNGQDIGIPMAFLRYVGYLICSKLAYTAWLIPFNAEKRTAYDMALGTNVFRPLGPTVPVQPPPPDSYYGPR